MQIGQVVSINLLVGQLQISCDYLLIYFWIGPFVVGFGCGALAHWHISQKSLGKFLFPLGVPEPLREKHHLVRYLFKFSKEKNAILC